MLGYKWLWCWHVNAKKKKGLWYEAWPISLCCVGKKKRRTSIWGWGGGEVSQTLNTPDIAF